MARRKTALGLLALLLLFGVAPAASAQTTRAGEPPALEGNRFAFHRPRNVTREYIVQFHSHGVGTMLIDVIDERRIITFQGKWAWRGERLCLEFPPTFNECFLLIRNRHFFLMARADSVEQRTAAAADPRKFATEGSWGSNPDLLGAGMFLAGW